VVNRTRLLAPFTPAADGAQEPVPLGSNSWTQAATELDQMHGVFSVTEAPGCAEMDNVALLTIFVAQNGGAPQQVASQSAFSPGTTVFDFQVPVLFEPGTAALNEFSATFMSFCDGDPTKRYTLTDLKIDVVGTR
jgi:hypothetical protein